MPTNKHVSATVQMYMYMCTYEYICIYEWLYLGECMRDKLILLLQFTVRCFAAFMYCWHYCYCYSHCWRLFCFCFHHSFIFTRQIWVLSFACWMNFVDAYRVPNTRLHRQHKWPHIQHALREPMPCMGILSIDVCIKEICTIMTKTTMSRKRNGEQRNADCKFPK